ncbi:hypothetical protein GCM10020220_003870 [Nonomuraea rubra]|uniref:phosphoribosylanthranilate isomerase n=1 Tax=Nonomuraea rubra TaxID=46180 RepID=UPI0031E72633
MDAPHAGSGRQWDWGAVRGRASGRWMLAGGLAPGNVREAIEAAGPWGGRRVQRVESAARREGLRA